MASITTILMCSLVIHWSVIYHLMATWRLLQFDDFIFVYIHFLTSNNNGKDKYWEQYSTNDDSCDGSTAKSFAVNCNQSRNFVFMLLKSIENWCVIIFGSISVVFKSEGCVIVIFLGNGWHDYLLSVLHIIPLIVSIFWHQTMVFQTIFTEIEVDSWFCVNDSKVNFTTGITLWWSHDVVNTCLGSWYFVSLSFISKTIERKFLFIFFSIDIEVFVIGLKTTILFDHSRASSIIHIWMIIFPSITFVAGCLTISPRPRRRCATLNLRWVREHAFAPAITIWECAWTTQAIADTSCGT